jgi:hypothetical protein
VNVGTVLVTYVVLATGHDILRAFWLGRRARWSSALANMRAAQGRRLAAERALIEDTFPRVVVSSGVLTAYHVVQPLTDAVRIKEVRDDIERQRKKIDEDGVL